MIIKNHKRLPETSKAVAPLISAEVTSTVSRTVNECPDADLSLQNNHFIILSKSKITQNRQN